MYRDFQLFMKRLRKRFGAGIRLYGCGEYGEKFGRPHYHVCLFNFEPPDKRLHTVRDNNKLYTSEILDSLWGMGFTLTGDVTFQSSAYVARYIMKKINGPTATTHYENVDTETGEIFKRSPEFPMMSRMPGIGKKWYEKYKSDVYPDDFVVIRGKKMRVPRFYDRQYEITDPGDYNRMKGKRLRHAKQYAEDQSPERLKVRETVQSAKTKNLKRDLD